LRAQATIVNRRTAAVAFVFGLALAATGAWRWRSRAEAPLARGAGSSVLLVTIDTLRADALGAYGNATVQTPWIDRLAREGVRFTQAHAQSVVTLPSHANILSGLYPMQHRIRDNAGFRFPKDKDTLATLLHGRGYDTAAFVSAFPLDARFGLARGFDVYDDRFSNVDTHTAFVMEERRGPETVALAAAWLAAHRDRPFFLWVHLYEPHFPYDPPPEIASRFASNRYLGEVSAADAALAPLLSPLLEAGASARTLVVLTADHGESLGEHGEMTHGIFAYESTLHVPLVLWSPSLVSPATVDEPVRHVDLVPTILDALALPPPREGAGRSILPLAEGRRMAAAPSYFESLSSAKNRRWAPLYGLIDSSLKLVDLPLPELYDLAADPHEAQNLAASRAQSLDGMRQQLHALQAGDPGWHTSGTESADVRERLKSLGYVTGAPSTGPRTYTDADDPKRLIGLDAQLQEAINRYKAGDLPGAIALCEDVVRRRPDMTLALSQAAFLYREQGRLEDAAHALERALAIDPEDAAAAALLGAYLNEGGQPQRAVAVLQPYTAVEEPDVDVVIAQGVAYAQLGRPGDALRSFERARQLDPGNPMPLVNVATVQLGARRYDEARQSLQEALLLNPRLARTHNALGVVEAETGHTAEAIVRWKRAVELEPQDFDTVYNLGRLLRESGRVEEARPYLERFAREAPASPYARDIAAVRAWLAGPVPRG
jgi:choline-sulfatase